MAASVHPTSPETRLLVPSWSVIGHCFAKGWSTIRWAEIAALEAACPGSNGTWNYGIEIPPNFIPPEALADRRELLRKQLDDIEEDRKQLLDGLENVLPDVLAAVEALLFKDCPASESQKSGPAFCDVVVVEDALSIVAMGNALVRRAGRDADGIRRLGRPKVRKVYDTIQAAPPLSLLTHEDIAKAAGVKDNTNLRGILSHLTKFRYIASDNRRGYHALKPLPAAFRPMSGDTTLT